MRVKTLTFPNADGQKLSAQIDYPEARDPIAYALFAHCFTCSKNTRTIAHISRALVNEGLAVMRLDFSGLGDSEGEFSDTNFSSNVSDLATAATYLSSHYMAPKLLIGHSFGGTAALIAATKIVSVNAVAVIAAPAEPTHVEQILGPGREQIIKTGQAELLLDGRPFKIKRQFLDDLDSVEVSQILPDLNRALLILHSPADTVVSIDNAAHLYQVARHPKSFISLYKADHMLSDYKYADYCGHMIAEWSQLYIFS